MSNLNDFFNKSVFVKGLDHPFSSNIAPSVDLTSLSEEEKNNIKFGIWDFKNFEIIQDDYSKVIYGNMRLFEKNNGRSITDDISFDSFISVEDADLVKVETDIRIERNVDGVMHDKVSVRDGMFPIGYVDSGYHFTLSEFYIMIDDGKRMVHYTDFSDGYEVYELNVERDLMSGFKIGKPIVFKDHDLDIDDPLLLEIKSVIKSQEGILKLIKR